MDPSPTTRPRTETPAFTQSDSDVLAELARLSRLVTQLRDELEPVIRLIHQAQQVPRLAKMLAKVD